MIHTLSFVIQQPLFSAQPSWIIFNKLKVRGGLDNVSGRSGADELNSWLLIGIYLYKICLLYTSDAADEEDSVDLGGRRIIKKKITKINAHKSSHCS